MTILVLVKCALPLSGPVFHLFSRCIERAVLPDEWRVHRITPIFKSGDRASVANYRPISLLSILSKVFERFIFDHILEFVSSSISGNQFGFLKHRSTVQQLLLFLDHLLQSKSTPTQFDSIYLDFSKAFDKVPHNLLLLKLRSLGIIGNLWQLLHHYLSDKSLCVAINNTLSPTLLVLSGVPQGSILGPLLFIIYVDDLHSLQMYSRLLMFADDTKCLSSPSDTVQIQHDLNELSQWLCLPFNVTKCSLIHFFSTSSLLSSTYYLNCSPVSTVVSQKDLGVLFTEDLSWSSHYKQLAATAYKTLGLLRRTFSSAVDIPTRKLLYTSLIRSKLTYASVININNC